MNHKRLSEFSNAPTAHELSTPVGWGLMGTSTTRLFEDEDTVTIRPVAIPIKAVGIWMYACLITVVVGGMLFPLFGLETAGTALWIIMVIGALFIIPTILGIFAWVNDQIGNSAYLILDKHDKFIELPRLCAKWPTKDVQGVYFVRCYVEGNLLFQVALLIQNECGKWIYAHVYNDGGDNHRNSWMYGSCLSEDQSLAKILGVRWSYLRFRPDGTIAQEKTMDNHAVNVSRP